MKSTLLLLFLLAGCSDQKDKVEGIKAFVQSCAEPVSASLQLGGMVGGNSLTMYCAKMGNIKP